MIDQKEVAIGQCGSGPGFQCTETMLINADFSIHVADTISEQQLDKRDAIVKNGNRLEYTIYKIGTILNDGKIIVSKEQKDTLEFDIYNKDLKMYLDVSSKTNLVF